MSPKELKAYLMEHVRYDVQMMRYAHDQVLKLDPGAERNAFIECFAVHARNLHEFLTGASDPRVVDARKYVRKFQPTSKDKVLKEVRHKITLLNQQVLHFGTTRTDIPDRKFKAKHGRWVLDWIEDTLAEFNNQLDPKYQCGWLPPRPPTLPIPAGSKDAASSKPIFPMATRSNDRASSEPSFIRDVE